MEDEENKMNTEENAEQANVIKNDNEENTINENMKIEKQDKTELDILKEKIEEQKEELDSREDRIKRLMAEFENFKKRSDKERTSMYNGVLGDVVIKLLPILDNLEKAVESTTQDEQYKNGIELVMKQFKDVLKENGVKEIEAVGKQFDPTYHEAVSLVEDSSLGAKVVKEEYRKGYMIGDRVLRHSLVVVAN